jgi:hypothetical protein
LDEDAEDTGLFGEQSQQQQQDEESEAVHQESNENEQERDGDIQDEEPWQNDGMAVMHVNGNNYFDYPPHFFLYIFFLPFQSRRVPL